MINTAKKTPTMIIFTVLTSDGGLTLMDRPPEDPKIILDEKKKIQT